MTTSAGFLPVLRRRRTSSWEDIDSERVLQVLVRNLDGMVFRCAIDQHWTLHFVSDGSRELTGYCPDELEFNKVISLEEVTHPEDRQRVRQIIGDAGRENGRYRVQYRIRHKDGSEKWVLERGAIVRDENETRSGKSKIERWLTTTIEKYNFQFKPLSSQERDNETVVTVEISGTFPGSPISLDYHFAIASSKIASLTIDS